MRAINERSLFPAQFHTPVENDVEGLRGRDRSDDDLARREYDFFRDGGNTQQLFRREIAQQFDAFKGDHLFDDVQLGHTLPSQGGQSGARYRGQIAGGGKRRPLGFHLRRGRVATGHWGLFGARQVIREHGGRREVRSEPGKGTEVRIELPCAGRPGALPLEA